MTIRNPNEPPVDDGGLIEGHEAKQIIQTKKPITLLELGLIGSIIGLTVVLVLVAILQSAHHH